LGQAIGGVIALEGVPEGRFHVALTSARYAPILFTNVSTLPGAPEVNAELRPGCLVKADLPPLSRGTWEIRDPDMGLRLMPVEPHTRENELWCLGVLAEGESYSLVAVDGPEVLDSQSFVAACGSQLLIAPFSKKL
jgi:hypothetical protein